ncbi:hypothetical protein AAFF_G00246850 [Aldrovandia affinis]|uniref:Lymphocyte cytosolic protein 2 n=1 Tax=Aldrovandia affinis TaxID=143900 RepID=A0AAD7WTP1_9TELE|nr:hypothetical protein AAFF_G00246850 [Aldrovandia affinis]
MSSDSVPSKAEVMSWNAPRLADYMKKMDLGGCDKVIMKYNMNGPRFLNMSDNDLQKFPKIHAPFISKICQKINKKEEKKRFFHKKSTAHKYPEPAAVADDACWDSEEFSDDDYESPDAEDEGSEGEYESPTEEEANKGVEDSDNEYEPPPSEPPDELPRQICPAKPLDESDYIDNKQNRIVSVKAPNSQPPVPPDRPGPGPPFSAAIRPGPPGLPRREPSPRREQSPIAPFRLPNRPAPSPPAPQVDRSKKRSTLERELPCLPNPPDRESPLSEMKSVGICERFAPPRRPPAAEKPSEPLRLPKPPIPGPGVSRSTSSVSRHTVNTRQFAQDHRNNFQDDATSKPPLPTGGPFSSNTFPLSSRGLPPWPGPLGTPFHPDSLPPNIPSSASLPSRLQSAVKKNQADRCPRPSPQPQRPPIRDPEPENEQDMNPRWYVGQVTRGQAEGSLRRINQDGTFLVRDSSRRSSTQPYTLMVLHQCKVYNIQIRYNNEQGQFMLGTGFMGRENFLGVKDIIEHHMHMPLLLIDAKDRGSGQQRQCLLTHPAGY